MIDVGMVWDMITESGNDDYDYPVKAGQEEFREFLGGGFGDGKQDQRDHA